MSGLRSAYDVKCPVCGVPVDAACIGFDGRRRSLAHPDRAHAAGVPRSPTRAEERAHREQNPGRDAWLNRTRGTIA